MPMNYEGILYRGDAQDVKELFEACRIENNLATHMEHLR